MLRTRPARPGTAPRTSACAAPWPTTTAAVRWMFAAACFAGQPGCTSALTTAYLRDALWEGREHAADVPPTDEPRSPTASGATSVAGPADQTDAERRQAAIEEAVERLARLGPLDAGVEATLVETLQATQQEDWPVVIDAFSATLAESQPRRREAAKPDATAGTAGPETASTAAPAPPEPAAAVASEPEAAATATLSDPEPDPDPDPEPAADPAAAAVEPPAAAKPAAATPEEFRVRNASFASRVQAWGQVDRFPADRFHAGQEVIVYFELDGLSAGESAAGFTTCIDTALRLVSDDGRELHAWRFEPVVETCVARRRDYFARYVVQLPEAAAAGPCRVEIAVTDTLSGAVATAAVPCELQ